MNAVTSFVCCDLLAGIHQAELHELPKRLIQIPTAYIACRFNSVFGGRRGEEGHHREHVSCPVVQEFPRPVKDALEERAACLIQIVQHCVERLPFLLDLSQCPSDRQWRAICCLIKAQQDILVCLGNRCQSQTMRLGANQRKPFGLFEARATTPKTLAPSSVSGWSPGLSSVQAEPGESHTQLCP